MLYIVIWAHLAHRLANGAIPFAFTAVAPVVMAQVVAPSHLKGRRRALVKQVGTPHRHLPRRWRRGREHECSAKHTV